MRSPIHWIEWHSIRREGTPPRTAEYLVTVRYNGRISTATDIFYLSESAGPILKVRPSRGPSFRTLVRRWNYEGRRYRFPLWSRWPVRRPARRRPAGSDYQNDKEVEAEEMRIWIEHAGTFELVYDVDHVIIVEDSVQITREDGDLIIEEVKE